ncbi:hypothetical protein STENM327S_07060 [Streptomyces tendae]
MPSGTLSSLMTARSCSGYEETSFAVRVPSARAVVTRNDLVSPTTWALVTTCPLSSYTMPDPSESPAWIWTTDGSTSLITRS